MSEKKSKELWLGCDCFIKSTEGKAEAYKVQERVGRIQQLREALREEDALKNGDLPQKWDPYVQVRHFGQNPAQG